MQQLDVYYQHFLIINTFSTCFGHNYAHLQENKTCVTARGVLRWYCWMWLVAVVGRCVVGRCVVGCCVVGRCVVGCEHCEGSAGTATNHIQQNQRSTPRAVTHVLFS